MAWEERRGGRYYYRKERRDGRVVSLYRGKGEILDMLTALEEAERAIARDERAEQRARDADERDRARRADAALNRLDEMIATLTRATLLTAGCHTHKGTWRKKRA